MKNIFYFFILLFSLEGFCQHAVSGYVNIENPEDWQQKVYLTKVALDNSKPTSNYIPITATSISKDGYFSFDKKWFDTNDYLYKVHINPNKVQKNISEKVKNFKLFILSKNDSIFFEKGDTLFASYTTNSKADKEWQQLKKFESQFKKLHDSFDTEQYLLRTKGYIKDSLQILLVKLISIKKLDDKKLLDKDIKEHTEYYTDLLQELKSSEIDPSLFLYLENKLSILSKEKTSKKYTFSLLLNGIAFLVIIILAILFIRSRKRSQRNLTIPLSKQENTIKELIISGKSNKEIANELFISISTVKTHISNIYSKLNISNRKELVVKK